MYAQDFSSDNDVVKPSEFVEKGLLEITRATRLWTVEIESWRRIVETWASIVENAKEPADTGGLVDHVEFSSRSWSIAPSSSRRILPMDMIYFDSHLNP